MQIKGIGGYLTLDPKQEMIGRVTDAVQAVEGEGLRQATGVTIEDVQPGACRRDELAPDYSGLYSL